MTYSWTERFGTVSSISKSHDLVPSGIPSLDAVIGGYPKGSLVLIIQDEFRIYSDMILNFFLAEGIANNDSLYVSSLETEPMSIVKSLPPPIEKNDEVAACPSDELKIAWRYQNVRPVISAPGVNKYICSSHDFDTKSKVGAEVLDRLDVHYWPKSELTDLVSLFNDVHKTVVSKDYMTNAKRDSLSVLRIGLFSLGSPFWGVKEGDLLKFLFNMRSLVHNCRGVLVVSLCPRLLSQMALDRCLQMFDLVISLSSLANSANPLYSEYSGLLKLLKLPSTNCLSAQPPEDVDWAFKVKRRRLTVEKFHLPPELPDPSRRDQDQDQGSFPSTPCQLHF